MKNVRQNKILELIKEQDIVTQEELALQLNKAGFNVTQATVSRDIRSLNLTKVQTSNGTQKYASVDAKNITINNKHIRILKEAFVSMDVAGNLLVIHTSTGMAMAVGTALDSLNLDEIIGCIAGDDTIFCATKDLDKCNHLKDKILKVLNLD